MDKFDYIINFVKVKTTQVRSKIIKINNILKSPSKLRIIKVFNRN